MLKRSPRSRIATIGISLFAVVGLYIACDALLTMRSLSSQYGARHTYFQITRTIAAGEQLSSSDFTTHEMFSSDIPTGALTSENNPESFYAKYALSEGAIVTKHMVVKNAISTTDDDHRIVFVPTDDVLSESISSTTDLLSVSSDGYSAEYVARNARILFDLSSQKEEADSHHGYFVDVTMDEAEEIIHALGTGDVRFALTSTNH